MFRQWSGDPDYLLELGVLPVTTSIPIKYTNILTYTAPKKVYQSGWSMDPNKQTNKMCNLTWKFPVDLGFRYLIRLHFCEPDFGVKQSGQREFSIFINNKTAEGHEDLIKWSGGNGVAMYRDYVVMIEGNRMEGKRDLIIALQPQYYESRAKYHTGAVLNGLEQLFNNLTGQNPKPLARGKRQRPTILAVDHHGGGVDPSQQPSRNLQWFHQRAHPLQNLHWYCQTVRAGLNLRH